ncbi:MAG: cell wall hydrolase [Oscillospiraceae bacterium]|nr:cell wall hydrolase [Oscillospiraceae bacterium]
MKRALCAALLALCLPLCACAAQAAGSAPTAAAALPSPPVPATPAPYAQAPVYCDGLLTARAIVHEGEVCLSSAFLCELFGLECALTTDGGGCTLSLPGVDVRWETGQDYARAGARYLYTPGGCLVYDEALWLPVQAAARLFGAELSVEEGPLRVEMTADSFRLMRGDGDYYPMHYRVDDLYWLSHIIQAEAGQEPLAGQIGVGNVVLNRVSSPLFPDTITEVVLERSGDTVQFEPTDNGSVHREVDEAAMLAACLCLEGFNTVGESLYFVNPLLADDTWFESARTFCVRIGEHDFYL